MGIALANRNWQVVRQCVAARRGIRLGRGVCTRSLHRLGFVHTRPKRRPLKADEARRAASVQEYVARLAEARAAGATILFADEAHSRADADPPGEGVLGGRPAPVDSGRPRRGEQAGDSPAVGPETGAVEHRELTGTSSSATSAASLRHVRATHPGPLVAIRDNGPAHGGAAVRDHPATPDRDLRLVRPPAARPDCNPDEATRARAREEVTANTRLGRKAAAQEQMRRSFVGLPDRIAEVRSRCRRTRQALAEALAASVPESNHEAPHVDPSGASV